MVVSSGVPQGSILGPLLFIIYINDLPTSVICNSDLFADDSVLSRKIVNEADCIELQEDIDRVLDWSKSWQLRLRTDKCKIPHVSRKKNQIHYDYHLNNAILSKVSVHKHLRIWLENTLLWDSHVNNICAKSNRVLGLIRRTFTIKNRKGIEVAFKALVLPILEYGCQVWLSSLESISPKTCSCFGSNSKKSNSANLWIFIALC